MISPLFDGFGINSWQVLALPWLFADDLRSSISDSRSDTHLHSSSSRMVSFYDNSISFHIESSHLVAGPSHFIANQLFSSTFHASPFHFISSHYRSLLIYSISHRSVSGHVRSITFLSNPFRLSTFPGICLRIITVPIHCITVLFLSDLIHFCSVLLRSNPLHLTSRIISWLRFLAIPLPISYDQLDSFPDCSISSRIASILGGSIASHI